MLAPAMVVELALALVMRRLLAPGLLVLELLARLELLPLACRHSCWRVRGREGRSS